MGIKRFLLLAPTRTARSEPFGVSFSAGSAQARDRQGRSAGFFGDHAVLLLDHGTRRIIAVEATQDVARHPAVGALRAVFVKHIEQGKLRARRWFSRHSRVSCRSSMVEV